MKILFLLLLSVSGLAAADSALRCEGLETKAFGDDVRITAAKVVATGALPEHCDVRGVIWPEAKFAVKLPTAWKERFQMVGNGGTAGVISFAAMDNALRRGFASASTDTGHDAEREPFATFAYVTPENPNGRRKFLDFAYLSVHNTAVVAKKIIQAYYGKAPRYSYWVGCSTGGRQGLQEAQRYPEDFDGYVIGAPGLFLTGNVTRRMWVGQSQLGAGEIKVEQLPALNKAVYDKCDAADGLADGIIEDPRRCGFRPSRDLPKCSGAERADCFTAGQMASIAKIYQGPRNSKGEQLHPGEPLGSESVWAENLIGPSKTVLPRSESQMKFAILDPPPGPSWSYTQFDFDKDPPRTQKAAAELNPRNPDLTPLMKRGGKVIHYSGWADQQVNPLPTIDYYQSVNKRMGEQAVRGFYRLYMVPGMFHCSGGPGCNTADWLGAVMEWVEKGVAPEQLTGVHLENGQTGMTRPLCPYPQVARHKGTGSIREAANFTCVMPK